jgi:hypothetical protein
MAQRRVLQWLLRAALTAVNFLRTATLPSLQASTRINVKVTRGLGRLLRFRCIVAEEVDGLTPVQIGDA